MLIHSGIKIYPPQFLLKLILMKNSKVEYNIYLHMYAMIRRILINCHNEYLRLIGWKLHAQCQDHIIPLVIIYYKENICQFTR